MMSDLVLADTTVWVHYLDRIPGTAYLIASGLRPMVRARWQGMKGVPFDRLRERLRQAQGALRQALGAASAEFRRIPGTAEFRGQLI